MPIMKSLSVVVMPTHMLPARAAPMAPGTMTAYFDQIEVGFRACCGVGILSFERLKGKTCG